MKPRLLDLFCGAGGAAKGYQEAGFTVFGVDLQPQPNYIGEAFVQKDALWFLLQWLARGRHGEPRIDFGAIHASPPCQAYTALSWHPQNRDIEHPELIEPTRELLIASGLPYVIENVEGAPLIEPTRLCGSAFGLPLKRHRLFETSFPMMSPGCAHGAHGKRFKVWRHGELTDSAFVPVYGTGGGKAAEHWPAAMGIDWMERKEMAQAIPPAYTRFIGEQLLEHINQRERSGVNG